MQFTIGKNDLVRELQTVTGVVEKRATLPILSNVLIEARESVVQIGASDLEVSIRTEAPATVSQAGKMTLPAAKLHEIARSLPDEEVVFKSMDRGQVAIQCGRARFRISGQPGDEFPSFPEIDARNGLELPARVFGEMIGRVAFAITVEDARYSLNGALMILQDRTLTLVATDGHRLAFVSKTLEIKAPSKETKIIVPRKALAEVQRMTADMAGDEGVVFGQSGNHAYFIVGPHKLTSNLLEGSFPRYENVMPKSCETGLTLSTEDLAQAVRRVSLLASERFGRAVRFALSSGKLELSSKTELGEAEETLLVDYSGPEISIGFNARYLLDFLNVVGSPGVRLELNPNREGEKPEDAKVGAGDKPGQLRPEPMGDMNYRYVVMPMHV